MEIHNNAEPKTHLNSGVNLVQNFLTRVIQQLIESSNHYLGKPIVSNVQG